MLHHLTQLQLARRWGLSPRTLEGWRWRGQGPRYLKVGKRILYRLPDVEAFEAEHVHSSTREVSSALDRRPGAMS